MSAAALITLAAGVLGAVVRYGVVRASTTHPAGSLWAVLLVNVAGSLLGGVTLGLAHAGLWGTDARLIVLSGLCGGLTTFSTLGVETMQLVQEGRSRVAAASVAANLALGTGAAALGWILIAILA